MGAGRVVVERTLSMAEGFGTPPSPGLLTGTQLIGGVLAWAQSDLDRADALLTPAVEQSIVEGDRRHEAMSLAFVGHVARDRGHYDVARTSHVVAGEIYDHLGNPRGSAWARFDLGWLAWQQGSLDEAADLLRESLTGFREIGYWWAVAWSTWALGSVVVASGKPEDGAALVVSGIDLFEEISDRRGTASCLETLAIAAGAQRRHTEALQLIGAASRLRTRLAVPLTESERQALALTTENARFALGEFRADSERQAGHDLAMSAVLGLAREMGGEPGRGPDPDAAPAVDESIGFLTPRERQVALLVADGATNQQIGSRLGITNRTAEAHIRNIMAKLDARSRAEVAVWAVTHGLGRE